MTNETSVDNLPEDEEVWIASGGVKIPFKDLSDQHLTNAHAHLTEKFNELNNSNHVDEQGELELDDMEEKLGRLEGEIRRRLNNKAERLKLTESPSLSITEARRQAEETYRRLKR